MQAQPGQTLPELSDYDVKPRSFLTSLMLVLISAGLVILSLRLLYTKFTSVISRDAVINGTLININAPEDGIIRTNPSQG